MSRFGMRALAVTAAAAITVGVLPAVSVAEGKDPGLPGLKQPKAVHVEKAQPGGMKRKDAAANPWKKPKVTWPAAATAEIDLAAPDAASATRSGSQPGEQPVGKKRAGSLPVSVTSGTGERGFNQADPTKIKVTVADHATAQKAGISGLLLSVNRADKATRPGSAQVELDYSAFKGAYGGDWAARLRLVQLPACALTTPGEAKCQVGTPLVTTNNTKANTLSANVSLAGAAPMFARSAASSATVLAATAGNSGGSGDYKATPLEASGAWSAGGSGGAFNWSYPIGVPSVPGGLQPSLGLSYSSQAVDGKTAASNSQGGWLGDGWSMEPGFVERRYKACSDDKASSTNTTKIGDQCWYNDNATLSLNGKNTELVYDKATGWHPADDSGEKVEKLTGADNGDKGTAGANGEGGAGEHWKITTPDGTQYFFGLNKLPGWRADNPDTKDKVDPDPVTNSTWTVPVFGNQPGEPCYNASFASAWCQQAWRWQLDYVVDLHGNAMSYYWNTETNNYGRNVVESTGKATPTSYVRGGWLDRIDYGLRSDSVYTAKAMGQVKFDVSERCLTTCGTFDETNRLNWPDVPYDLYCKDGATECKGQFSPTFWSRKRLTMITTRVLTGGVYKDVDSWALDQGFPANAGDGISYPMWLKSITRTGRAGGTTPLPPVTFTGQGKANRVDKTGDGLAPYIRLRMSQITTESGATIGVDYLDPDCTATTLPAADGTNTTRCFPVKWHYEGETAKQDWFNSYVVQRVIEGDNLATTPDTVTEYSYLDGAKWVKSTDEFAKPEDRTYSVARGYERVQTRKGADKEQRTLTETRYFRGIDGAAVKDSAGVSVADREQFAGMKREVATYNGDGGPLVSATSYTPWRSDKTAGRPRTGLPDLQAFHTGTEKETTRTTVTDGTRTTELTRHYDSYGMPDTVSQAGDVAKSGDERCTTTIYVRNTGIWLLDTVSQTKTVALPCGTASDTPRDATIDDTRTYYDNNTDVNSAPSKGEVTKTEKIKGAGLGYDTVTSIPSTCGPLKTTLCYDQYGRTLASADAYGKVTTTAFTPASGEAATKKLDTNPLGHTVATLLDPLRGQPTQVTDANGKVTTTAYDGLGRVIKTWIPTRSVSEYPNSANYTFDYQIHNDAPNVVTSTKLTHDDARETTYAFYDGLLRPRETQTESPDRSGRLITEMFYNTRGETNRSSGTYYATGKAEPVLVTGAESSDYPASAETIFDGAGRTTVVIGKRFGDETARTTTRYTGDTTTVVPPKGGTTTTTVVDALGRTIEQRQYTDAEGKNFQSTLYTYNSLGRLEQLTDPSGAKWTYRYDSRGRQTHVDDPDKGASDIVYDQGDRTTDTTDARGITLHTDYDALGRPTARKNGAATLATWTYDTAAKGKPAKSTRYDGTNAFTAEVKSYDDLYNPNDTAVTVPASEGKLAGTYEWYAQYNANSNQLTDLYQPALASLPEETVNTSYTAVHGLPNTVHAGNDPLISDVTYDHYGRATRLGYGAFSQHVWSTTEYDDHTGRPTRVTTDKDTSPKRVDDTKYTYDPAGNITSIAAALGQDTARTTDTQCFTTDALQRITEAWTNSGEQCAGAPSADVVGGPDAFWTSYAYDPVGNRKTETQHKTASGPVSDTTRTYAEPANGTHKLPKVTQTGASSHEETYSYDEAGNTKTRTAGPRTQNLTWDDEGHLKTLADGANTTSYLYDTDGQRLIRRDSTGTTLYLPGGNELHADQAGVVTGTRYYSAAGQTVAMRTGGKLTYLLDNHQGTVNTQISADATQTVTRRKTTIFGAPRGDQPAIWAGDKGFVGGTKDADTGLTHLGAREYDPIIGRFISVDPVLESNKPQSLTGYAYAENNPVTLSDPTGLYTVRCNPCSDEQKFVEEHVSPDTFSGETWESKYPTYRKLKNRNRGSITQASSKPTPQHYQYEVNGVCVWAMASSCETVDNLPTTAAEVPDLPCTPDEAGWICDLRNSYYKSMVRFGPLIGMAGASRGLGGRTAGSAGAAVAAEEEGAAGALARSTAATSDALSEIAESFSTEKLSALGKNPEKNNFTRAGLELQKHANRTSNTGQWPYPSGKKNPWTWSDAGQEALDGILNDKRSAVQRYVSRNGDHIIEYSAPWGGAMFKQTGGQGDWMFYSFREYADRKQP
ncbi:RHS repeat domain-containing protein [Streptomyces violascens]|uniref:RHS repeat domain-containing protein n=1 Tax=Streptomyces violascens TaxID=67381 RepID=UPI001CFF46A8|nr:RHS repeat-associated core domain-containing protein [Streptomyces violascens]